MQKYRNELEIIDFGSGKCHLSRILSLCYGYKAHCIEADDNNINGAIVQDYKTMKALMKFRPKDLSDGLHACGSLSNWILEEFARNSNSNCLILACCCYMRKELGPFPMSDCLKRKKDNKFLLTLEARELACHAVEKFLDKIIGNDLDSLRIHGYRAALELLIEKYAPQKRHVPMRTVTNISKIDFIDYVRRAIERMDDIILPNEAFQSDSIQKILNTKINRVAIFYSLRLLIAPIVEFFILMDYERFLCEQSSIRTAQIMPVFDPLISPRNLLLIAYK
ncbi:RRNAD1-like protein [Sarcoptes scabiei]|uniref:rRNAD1-like protein n=1 Tax=Sarcoptes scabiei TaxID=52283 RepID=A0A131ZV48_SARSC|nr:RRNAD1-like protein [Sarcoptes scabiei]